MAMVILIVAFAENLFVLFVAPAGIVEAVSGVEMGLPAGCDDFGFVLRCHNLDIKSEVYDKVMK
jgi:hypothetical protein